MTYPPQQPGQGGPYQGGQGPYGQQPYQGYGQPQPGQMPAYPQAPQGDFGFPDGPPPKKKTGLIVAIVVGVVLLVGGGITLAVLLTGGENSPAGSGVNPGAGQPGNDGGSGGGDPQEVAEEFADLFVRLSTNQPGQVPASAFAPVTCAADVTSLEKAIEDEVTSDSPSEVLKDVTATVADLKTSGNSGTFTLSVKATNPSGTPAENDIPLGLVQEDGGWKVCGVTNPAGASGSAGG